MSNFEKPKMEKENGQETNANRPRREVANDATPTNSSLLENAAGGRPGREVANNATSANSSALENSTGGITGRQVANDATSANSSSFENSAGRRIGRLPSSPVPSPPSPTPPTPSNAIPPNSPMPSLDVWDRQRYLNSIGVFNPPAPAPPSSSSSASRYRRARPFQYDPATSAFRRWRAPPPRPVPVIPDRQSTMSAHDELMAVVRRIQASTSQIDASDFFDAPSQSVRAPNPPPRSSNLAPQAAQPGPSSISETGRQSSLCRLSPNHQYYLIRPRLIPTDPDIIIDEEKTTVKRTRTVFSKVQVAVFEEYFERIKYITRNKRAIEEMEVKTGATAKQIKDWFANRRAKDRRQMKKAIKEEIKEEPEDEDDEGGENE